MTSTRTAASIAELMDRVAARRLTCGDPATDLLPEDAAGVLDYVLMQRRVPQAVLRADAEDALLLVALLRRQADEIEHSTIRLARAMGVTWSRIADLRGKHSPQAAEQLYQRLAAAVAGDRRQVGEGREHTRPSRHATPARQRSPDHRKVHIDDDTWERFGHLAVEAGTNRSAVLREETRNWIRRRERRLAREKGSPGPAPGRADQAEVAWAAQHHAEAVSIAEALTAVQVPEVAAESAAWVAEVLHDSDAPATWLAMALRLVYKELKGLGLRDQELKDDQQLSALPSKLGERLAALSRAWDEVTPREPQARATRPNRQGRGTAPRRQAS
jgi:hypothetical protein